MLARQCYLICKPPIQPKKGNDIYLRMVTSGQYQNPLNRELCQFRESTKVALALADQPVSTFHSRFIIILVLPSTRTSNVYACLQLPPNCVKQSEVFMMVD